ncbi:hypothetical protein H0H92_006600 [Tricholoma furcatifolium]|nr:hypothetical protein H0H92_006600 [Tricholoma furcatifolium]
MTAPPVTTNPATPRPTESLPHAYRLLYRGSLSLPDSHLLLDGLTFAARLDTPSKSNLLQNPLALALESMRGRPSLRFVGVVKLHGVTNFWLDESGGIEMSVGKRADGPETTQMIIFARTNQDDKSLNLIVARLSIVPLITQSSLRLPRPDDPTPRKPPILFASNASNGGNINGARSGLKVVSSLIPGRGLKRTASTTTVIGPKEKKVARIDGAIVADLGSGVRLGESKEGDQLFKVPEIPLHGRLNIKGKEKQVDGDKDVFGSSTSTSAGRLSKLVSKGKRKRDSNRDSTREQEGLEIERTNKDVIKRCTLDYLYKKKDPTVLLRVDKSHPEFKEIFSWISRGVGFALRSYLRVRPVDIAVVERLVRIHMDMYVGGDGGESAIAPADDDAVA